MFHDKLAYCPKALHCLGVLLQLWRVSGAFCSGWACGLRYCPTNALQHFENSLQIVVNWLLVAYTNFGGKLHELRHKALISVPISTMGYYSCWIQFAPYTKKYFGGIWLETIGVKQIHFADFVSPV